MPFFVNHSAEFSSSYVKTPPKCDVLKDESTTCRSDYFNFSSFINLGVTQKPGFSSDVTFSTCFHNLDDFVQSCDSRFLPTAQTSIITPNSDRCLFNILTYYRIVQCTCANHHGVHFKFTQYNMSIISQLS